MKRPVQKSTSLKMSAAGSTEALVPIYQAPWYNVQEDSNKVCIRLLLDVFFVVLKDR
jgi:hypothetical protein